jgi:hypothetical protein
MSTMALHLSRPATSRRTAIAGAVALGIVAMVHMIDGPGSLADNRATGLLELALAAAAVPLAVALVVSPVRDIWIAAGAVTAVALGFYVASRTVGLLGSTDDIGNWLTFLGVVNVVSELAVVGLAARVTLRRA